MKSVLLRPLDFALLAEQFEDGQAPVELPRWQQDEFQPSNSKGLPQWNRRHP